MYAIGIDIGTTSVCGVLTDISDGTVVKSCTVPSEAFLKTYNVWEKIQDTEKIIRIAINIIDDFLDENTVVIGVTGQMHGIVYTDITGKAISPLYTWQDKRGNLSYKKTTYADFLGSYAGYGCVTDFYNKENDIRKKTAESFCTIGDYLVMVLCGNEKPIIHNSNAASLGCYDIKNNKFSYDVNAIVTKNFDIAGEYKGIPVAVAVGDNQSSVFSTLADEDDVLINIGTGSQVSVISNNVICGENIESRPYFEDKYLSVGAALCGGRAYSLLMQFYSEIIKAGGGDAGDVYSVMDKMLRGKSGTTLKADTRFEGTRTNPEIKGSINGITTENFTPAELTYAVLDGMAEELSNIYANMGVIRKNVVGSGNGIRKNIVLSKIVAEKFDGVIKIPLYIEEAACGAALFGLVACGKYKGVKAVQSLIKYEKSVG